MYDAVPEKHPDYETVIIESELRFENDLYILQFDLNPNGSDFCLSEHFDYDFSQVVGKKLKITLVYNTTELTNDPNDPDIVLKVYCDNEVLCSQHINLGSFQALTLEAFPEPEEEDYDEY